MPVPPDRQRRLQLICRTVLLGVAAACASGGTPGAAPASPGAPGPARASCALVADSGVASPDTIWFIAEPGAPAWAAGTLTGCSDAVPGAWPAVDSIAVPRGGDLRDFLDRGAPTGSAPRVDVAVTRDPDVLSYAAQLGTYRSVALPWDRTYTLVAPRFDSSAATPTTNERDALARDAVQADARGALPPFWWETDTACATGTPRFSPGAPRIVGYPADDPIARQLAERIVALAGAQPAPAWIPSALAAPTAGPLRTAGFAPTALDDALASGQIAAFIAAFPRARPAACGVVARIPSGALILPLVDSRAHALLRRGSGAAFLVDADGALRFVANPTP
jgi:hypothetical protein